MFIDSGWNCYLIIMFFTVIELASNILKNFTNNFVIQGKFYLHKISAMFSLHLNFYFKIWIGLLILKVYKL